MFSLHISSSSSSFHLLYVIFESNNLPSKSIAPSGIRAASSYLKMPHETRSQDVRKVDETTNPEHTRTYDQIQQQLNDTKADTNARFRELNEVIDALIFHVNSALQKTQLSTSESSLPKASQYPVVKDSSAKLNWATEGTPLYYQLRRPKGEFPVFEGEDVLK
jgi:hypothetical protein